MKIVKTFEEWNPFKRKEKEKSTKEPYVSQWAKDRKMIDDEAEKAGYNDVDDYLDYLVNSGQMTDNERSYYQFG